MPIVATNDEAWRGLALNVMGDNNFAPDASNQAKNCISYLKFIKLRPNHSAALFSWDANFLRQLSEGWKITEENWQIFNNMKRQNLHK